MFLKELSKLGLHVVIRPCEQDLLRGHSSPFVSGLLGACHGNRGGLPDVLEEGSRNGSGQ